jgi:hypothetical protein
MVVLPIAVASRCGPPPVDPAPPPPPDEHADVQGLLESYVQGTVDNARNRELEKSRALIDETLHSLESMDPEAPDETLAFMDSKSRQRVAAFLRCAVLATGDHTWCDELTGSWPEEHKHCTGVSALWTLVGLRVIRNGETCPDVLAEEGWLPPFVAQVAPALCSSMADGDPDSCPWPAGTEDQATCLGIALRDGSKVCHEVDEDKRPDWWPACCERGIESFAQFVSPDATAETSPAMGAASGDIEGCTRALENNLMADLAPFFRFPDTTIPPESELFAGESACRLIIHWME